MHEETRGLVNADLLGHFKKGAWLVNTARGAICDKDAIASALANGHLRGYAGDVWDVQPAPKDHVWRKMKNPFGGGNGMVPHYSGTTLDAQARYSAGVKAILENYLRGTDQEPQNIIVGIGKYESKACKCWLYRNSLPFLQIDFVRWPAMMTIPGVYKLGSGSRYKYSITVKILFSL